MYTYPYVFPTVPKFVISWYKWNNVTKVVERAAMYVYSIIILMLKNSKYVYYSVYDIVVSLFSSFLA